MNSGTCEIKEQMKCWCIGKGRKAFTQGQSVGVRFQEQKHNVGRQKEEKYISKRDNYLYKNAIQWQHKDVSNLGVDCKNALHALH